MIRVRRMTSADLPNVVSIDQSSFSLPWPASSFEFELHRNAASRCLVLEREDGGLIGMAVSWLIEDELHIATFAVEPSSRRQGFGQTLLRKVLSDGIDAGARKAMLEVRESNQAARALYGHLGFTEAGRRPKYYRDNNEDAILMSCVLGAQI